MSDDDAGEAAAQIAALLVREILDEIKARFDAGLGVQDLCDELQVIALASLLALHSAREELIAHGITIKETP